MSKNHVPRWCHHIYFILTGWTLSLGFMLTHVFYPLRPSSVIGGSIYESMHRDLWAASICWIIFACHQLNSGGVLRSFLSSVYWQPLSKLCLSTYLIHFVYILLSHLNLKELHWVNTWGQFPIYIADIGISTVLGTLFFLMIEAPTAGIIQLVWAQIDKAPVNVNVQKLT